MLFEQRETIPAVSPDWESIRDLFLSGQSREAWRSAVAQRGDIALTTANDYLLNIEIARACSVYRTYLALVRMAAKVHPEDPIVQLYNARMLLTRGMHLQGVEYLKGLESTLGKTHPINWTAELANVYGNAGFESSCQHWLGETEKLGVAQSALALYTISCAQEGMQRWPEAIEFAKKCVEVAPNWSRVRSHLVNCLLTQGRIDEASEVLAEGERRGHEESVLDFSGAMLSLSLGDFAVAETRCRALLADWPNADFRHWVRRTLCILLVELGRSDEARQFAEGKEEQLSLPSLATCSDDSPRRFIPLPLIAQNKNQCVPTSVAMAAYSQGTKLDPARLFVEMKGRNGTSLWRMREWLHDHGFQLVPVRLEQEAIVAMLNLGIPLMGILENPFNSHVELICGFNQAIDVYYVRDPMHWAPIAMPTEMAHRRYELYGAVLAIIDEQSTTDIESAKSFYCPECDSLIQLARAVAHGDRTIAAASYLQIRDDSPLAFMRDVYAYCVAISPATFNERMKLYASSEEANSISRFRALLTLGSQDAQEILQRLVEDATFQLGESGRRYLRLLSCMHDGRWTEAKNLVERMLLFGSSVSNFWELKSDILAELGDQSGSQTAIELAIELDPYRMSLREKALNHSATHMTFAEYLDEFEAILEGEPDNKSLLWGKAIALLDGPDGKAFEQVAQEYLRWFPRDPRGYSNLSSWYRQQGRNDLADELEQTGNLLLDNLFDAAIEPVEDASDSTNGALPQDKQQLLTLLGTYDHPRKQEVLQKLLRLEADGHLLWHERAQLLAIRLTFHVDAPAGESIDPKAQLPSKTPGAAHWFANHVTELVEQNNPTITVATAVVDWVEQVVPEYRNYPGLWFNRTVLMEKTQHVERAFEELSEFLKIYPAYSSAMYRMGVVKYQQNYLQESIGFFQNALKTNPGLYGAMYVLRIVHDTLGDTSAWFAANSMLRRKFPYDFNFFRDAVNATATHDSTSAAEDLLRESSHDFCANRVEVLRAQLRINSNDLSEAEEILSGLNLDDDSSEELHEDALLARLNLASARQSRKQVLALCEEGLSRWPDSTRLKEIKAEYLSDNDLSGSLNLLEAVLCEGEPSAQTAFQYLSAAKAHPDHVAKYAIERTAEDRRQALAELFAEAMAHPTLERFNGKYLAWACKTYPESDNLRYRQVIHLNVNGDSRQAIKVARELYQRNPDHPDAARMLGRCLLDTKAKEALPYLEKACEQNRSADNLFEFARGCHVAGKLNRAIELHWEILELNPYMSASLANLQILGVEQRRLWPFVNPMLEYGCGAEEEYFLITAVQLAKSQKKQVAPNWINIAAQRWIILKTRRGFQDEQLRLKKSILAWLIVRPQDADGHVGLPSGPIARLDARYFWPRCRWVPSNKSS